mgnify:FL=1
MIVIIMSCHKLLVISMLYNIIEPYDNKDKQDKQNISYWEEFILLMNFSQTGWEVKQS